GPSRPQCKRNEGGSANIDENRDGNAHRADCANRLGKQADHRFTVFTDPCEGRETYLSHDLVYRRWEEIGAGVGEGVDPQPGRAEEMADKKIVHVVGAEADDA